MRLDQFKLRLTFITKTFIFCKAFTLLFILSASGQALTPSFLVSSVKVKDVNTLVNYVKKTWLKKTNPNPVSGPEKEESFDNHIEEMTEGTTYIAAEDNALDIRTISITKFKKGNVQIAYFGVSTEEVNTIEKYLLGNGFVKGKIGNLNGWKSSEVSVTLDEGEVGNVFLFFSPKK